MPNESSTARIRNVHYAGGALLLGLLFTAFAAFVWWAILTGRTSEPSDAPEWVFILFIGVPALLAGVICPLEMARVAVLWLEVGPRLRYRTLLGARSREWSEVRSWGFEDEQSKVELNLPFVAVPLGRHRILSIKLGPWTDLRVKVRPEEEGRLRELIARWSAPAE